MQRLTRFYTSAVLSTVLLMSSLALLIAQPTASYAQTKPPVAPAAPVITDTVSPEIAVATADPANSLLFSRLGLDEPRLTGPTDAIYRTFDLPPTWALTDGAEMQLHIETIIPRSAASPSNPSNTLYGGTLKVLLNDKELRVISLDHAGDQVISIPIPMSALTTSTATGSHVLYMALQDPTPCDTNAHTIVVVHPSSRLVLPHTVADLATTLNLNAFPSPIYRRMAQPESAMLVLPDAPTASELQAALNLAAGLGRITEGRLPLLLSSVSKMTDALWQNNHLIFVGKPAGFPILKAINLPANEDGVMQLLPSPFTTTKALLVVSGSSDVGVLKAARALSSGVLRSGALLTQTIVADVQPTLRRPILQSANTSFAELGYDEQRAANVGANYTNMRFELPAQASVAGAYLDLSYAHSALLDYEKSGLTVSLNGQPVGAVRFDDNSARLSSARIGLPAAALRPGINQITFQTDLIGRTICPAPTYGSLWVSLHAGSVLVLPGLSADNNVQGAAPLAHKVNLIEYPQPFAGRGNLDTLAFVLPTADPAAWQAAAQIAFDLGRSSEKTVLDIAVAFSDGLTPELRRTRDVILVGKATNLPLIGEINAKLPASFPANSNLATEKNLGVEYRQPEGADVGYLQLLPSPWNSERVVLVALGSTDAALQHISAALSKPNLRSQLNGNLVVVSGDRIVSGDTQLQGAGSKSASAQSAAPAAGAQPNTVNTANTGNTAITATQLQQTPPWLLPAVIVFIGVLLLVIVAVAFINLRGRAGSASSSAGVDGMKGEDDDRR